MWDRARDLVQILIIPTIMWSLWVSRGVEIQRLQLEQSAAEVAELKAKVASLEERAGTTKERLAVENGAVYVGALAGAGIVAPVAFDQPAPQAGDLVLVFLR